ncbi:hypothetical protein OHA72_39740 [Dactylosporangium sp. NBC_01737]|uniref:hypothetical protein n=1 Tax=Dactylosporangium sp. NBC_01737 TaxID=2975959 RepID=UPI002E161C61|nr:hypothetical protein OHA72_39740 [Dactylosporangium sp. NBC_01737]
MRNRFGQTLAGVTAVLALATACARGDVARDPAAAVTGHPVAAPADARDVEVYVQVLRRYLGTPNENSFPERTFRKVFVLDRTVPGIGDPQPHQAPRDAIPGDTQQRIAGALADLGPVSFVADRDSVIETEGGCGVVKDEGILITLGPVDGRGDRVEVGINGYVACLGATWLTYIVEHTAGTGWRVTGTTGSMTIS